MTERATRSAQPTVITSPMTFVMKVVFPAIWLSLFGWATVHFMSGGTSIRWGGGIQPPWWAKWVFLLVLMAGSWIIGRGCIPLKKITLAGDMLLVSNFLQEISLPLAEIAEVGLVSGMRVNDTPVGYLSLAREGRFGKELMFYPRSEQAFNLLRTAVDTRGAGKMPAKATGSS